jgi:hypothetical protein
MSRGVRHDVRGQHPDREVERRGEAQLRPHDPDNDLFGRHLSLPRGGSRDRVEGCERAHLLDETDMRTLATVGAFRVVPIENLEMTTDLRRLINEELITCQTLADTAGSQRIGSLTSEGLSVLEANRNLDRDGPDQAFYAGVVRPRELAHDAQVYRAFKEEEGRIRAEGGRVTRLVLDYELKREYQRFLNRADRPDDATLESDRRTFAEAHHLPIVRGHLELPDLRIEYDTADGRTEHRDVEIVTEHYSRGQIAGKSLAGFACYRAAGSQARRGGTPLDPRHLTRLS